MAPPAAWEFAACAVLAQSWFVRGRLETGAKLFKTARVIDNGGGRMLGSDKVGPPVRFAVPDGKTIELRAPAR